jgi:thiol:disulfide interchange protein
MQSHRLSGITVSVAATVFLCIFPPHPVAAGMVKVEPVVSFKPEAIRATETAILEVAVEIPSGYHLYSMTKIPDGPLQLSVKTTDPDLEPLTEWHGPTPKVEHDPNFKKTVEYHSGEITYSRAYRYAAKATGLQDIAVTVRGQICDEKQCIPFKQKLKAALQIVTGAPRPDFSKVPTLSGEVFKPDRKPPPILKEKDSSRTLPLEGGLIGFLVIAFLAGLGALVTPCVFPMIPITISFFSKYSKVSIRRSVTMATIYATSIIATFTLIGVIVSLIFGAVGMQTLSASPLFNIFLTVLLFVFAFNLFGLFEIQVPNWLVSRSSRKEQELTADDGSLGSQAAGVFFMALTFTLVSFTCTVGFIGIVLAEAAKGNWFYPAIGMLSFSLAFSLPFFLLAIFPSWAEKLQGKGGDWMVAVKVILGFLEFAGAFKFLSNVDLVWQWGFITRPFVLAIWVAIFFTAGLFLLRVFNLPHSDQNNRTLGPIRMFFAMCMFAIAAYAGTGIRDTKSMGGWLDGWLPPAIYPGQEATYDDSDSGDHLPWIVDDIDSGMEKGRQSNLPVFVDFTGYTCTNCRYMEGSVFPRSNVQSRLRRMVLVTAYTDADNETSEKQRDYQIKRFDTAALPFYAIINPHDDTILATFASMTNDVNEYVDFLDKGLAAFERVKPKTPEPPSKAPATSAQTIVTDAGTDAHEDISGEHTDISVQLTANTAKVDFSFPGLFDGKTVKLSSLRGSWVFVNFWASWCAPCKKELLQDFPPAFATHPQVKLVTVAFDGEDTKEAALKFGKEAKLDTQIALQGGEDIEEAGLTEEFDVSESLPISYLVHPDGHIAWMRKGSVDKELLGRLFAQTK